MDMVKAAIPTFIVYYYFPGELFFLATALFTMIGHNFPLYHGFRGGSGLSPLIGALLVINWFGLLLSFPAAMILGYLTGSVLVIRWSWMGILIPWFALYFDSPWYAVYMALATSLFFFTLRKELVTGIKIGRSRQSTQEEVSEFMLMGRGLGRFIDRYGFPALIRKLFS
jgi:glycerol-3-phosphate acyltransferase PlsY